MKDKYKRIEIAKIKDLDFSNYIGYIWYSDQEKPILISKERPFGVNDFTELPFIIEGNLFSEREKVSIQIKNIDGEYSIAKIQLDDELINNAKKYVGHDLGKDYKMVEAWEEFKDPLCQNMNALRPAWRAFAGFTTINIQKK